MLGWVRALNRAGLVRCLFGAGAVAIAVFAALAIGTEAARWPIRATIAGVVLAVVVVAAAGLLMSPMDRGPERR